MSAVLTIKDLIDNQMSFSVHCNANGCGHGADLDMQAIGDRLGYAFVAVGDPNPLIAKLRCGKCGSKDIGLILSSRSGYSGASAPVAERPAVKASDIPVNSRKSRRRQRLV